MVIFINLQDIIFSKKTLSGNLLIVRKLAKISALNPIFNMIWEGGGAVVTNFIHYIKKMAGAIILKEAFELILTRRTYR